MDDKAIIKGVNCHETRWIYRGIAMLASVVWLTRLTVELLWPSLCSSWSTWKEESNGFILMLAAPFLYTACMVVRSFCVPVPVPVHVPVPSAHTEWHAAAAVSMATMGIISHELHTVEWCIYWFSAVAGLLATTLLSKPRNDVHVQQIFYVGFVMCLVCLVGYLGYQQTIWLTFVIIVALVLFNSLLFAGRLRRLQLKPQEEEDLASV